MKSKHEDAAGLKPLDRAPVAKAKNSFTKEELEKLQNRVAGSPERDARVDVTGPGKLRARVGKSGVQFFTWRHERGTKTRVVLGELSETFGIKEAETALAASTLKPLSVVQARRTSFGDVAKAYYQDRLSRTKRGPESWAHTYQKHIDPRLGRYPVNDITPAVIRKAISEIATPTLAKDASRPTGGPGAARHALRLIRAVLSRALADRLTEYNAAASLPLRELGLSQKRRERWLDEELAPELFEAINLKRVMARKPLPEFSLTAQVRLGLAFLFYLPVRSGSLTGAKVEEFDLKPRVGPALWTVPASRIKGATQPQVLPLVGTALEIVKELLRLAKEAECEYLLPSPSDPKERIAEKTLTQTFRRLERSGRIGPVAEDGTERLTLHSLRASWRSWALELGVPAEVAERVMGHRSALAQLGFSSAAQLYTRSAALKLQAEALQKVSDHLDLFWRKPGGKVVALRPGHEDAGA
jgi:integrase